MKSPTSGEINKRQLYIVGVGGHGRVIADLALKMNRWQRVAFVDDNSRVQSSMGIEVVGTISDALLYGHEHDFFVAIGNNETRERIQIYLEESGARVVTLIHPSAIIGDHVELGSGTVVMAGAVINCCSVIGKGCIINTGSTVDHDNVIEDYVHISPGVHIAGTVKVGKGTWLGIGSSVINNVNIAGNCLIGAGTVVVKDIPSSGKYIGVPARRL